MLPDSGTVPHRFNGMLQKCFIAINKGVSSMNGPHGPMTGCGTRRTGLTSPAFSTQATPILVLQAGYGHQRTFCMMTLEESSFSANPVMTKNSSTLSVPEWLIRFKPMDLTVIGVGRSL